MAYSKVKLKKQQVNADYISNRVQYIHSFTSLYEIMLVLIDRLINCCNSSLHHHLFQKCMTFE